MFRTAPFDRLLDKATSQQNLEPDWSAIIQITDMIRQGDVQPKDALASIKKKLTNPNPHVVLYALLALESCMKNCGSLIHDEVGTKGFMEQIIELARSSQHEDVKNRILALIQAWAHAFRNSPKYRAVPDGMNIMKTEGFQFPVLNESDAMFKADTAPEWVDGDACHRCRIQFSMVLQRKHHCRACGQVFCGQCSSKNTTLPKFGIEKEVRVCEDCYEKFTKNARSTTAAVAKPEEMLPAEYLSSSLALQSQAPPPKPGGDKTEEELKEEEELQLAIALSQSEAESQKTRSWTVPASTLHHEPSAAPVSRQPLVEEPAASNPELAKYLDRTYWEQKREATSEGTRSRNNSASAPSSQPPQYTPNNVYPPENHNNHSNHHNSVITSPEVHLDSELEDFIHALKTQVEIFVNRMKSNSSRGRHVSNDSSVQTLFVNITRLHSRLLVYIQEKDDKRVYYEGLQDKLTQVKDARAALDALREEAAEKLRAEAEAAERAKQIAMAAKLDLMRKKKQEYLQYQRSLALQKVQERELELQQRQRRLLHQQNSQGYYDPNMPPGPGVPHYSQPGPPQYHQYNMMPPGPPGSEMWAPDSKPMMNPGMLPMGQQSLPGGPPMGPPLNQPMNQGPPFNQGPPGQMGQMGPNNPQMVHPMQPDLGMMGPGIPNNRLSMGPNNPPGAMNPAQIPGGINPNVTPMSHVQMNPAGSIHPNSPHGSNPAQLPTGPMNPNIPHSPMPQQAFQQGSQSGGPGSNTSLPPQQQEVKNEDNTAELISFD